jgi:hypothetical protein
MKKITALLLTVIILLSITACNADESAPESASGAGRDVLREQADITREPENVREPAVLPEPPERLPHEPPPEPDWVPDDLAWEEQLAYDIRLAFINKDTGFLSSQFGDSSGRAFNFLHQLEFAEFEFISSGFNDMYWEWAFYFNIVVENGTNDIFTLGGREWELRIAAGAGSAVQLFAPLGKEVNSIWNSTFAPMCYSFSSNLFAFETMRDFNLLKSNFAGSDAGSFTSYSKNIGIALGSVDYNIDVWSLTADQFIEMAAYTFGITNIDRDELQTLLDRDWAHGWYWHYSSLVSEEITDTGAVVVLNFYGDAAGMFVAKTMKYTLERGIDGIRFVSVELIYSNDDLVLAIGAV